MQLDTPLLRQRGRASVDFLTHLGMAAGPVREAVARDIAAVLPDPAALPDDLDARSAEMNRLLAHSDAYGAQTLMGDWHSRHHGPVATAAFEEIEPELLPALTAPTNGPAQLHLDPDLIPPDYWDGVHFHRTANWDGHQHMGYIHGEIIHRKMVDKLYPGGIFKQRRAVAAMPPRDDYARILEMGTSSGHFTSALAEVYPQAEITGIDLSPRMLEHAWRTANSRGLAWKLYQRDAADTGFADASFDLVTSYIVLHEMPEAAIRDMFAEAFRVLEPGGDMIMSDVTRYADLDKLSVWKADRSASLGGEPHWRASASLDLGAIARAAGFAEVTAAGTYPHVVQGRKPA